LSAETQRWVIVARILRPRGNKGEVAAALLTDFPERLTRLTEVFLGASGGAGAVEPRPAAVKACWLSQNHKGQAVFHFEGCNSISEAEKFRGLDVFLPIEQRATLSASQFFVDDLIGCSVFENAVEPPVVSSSPGSLANAPALLGVVRDVQITGEGVAGTPILAVDTSAGELLIPLAEDICLRVDTRARRIDVTLPDGLRELNEKA
jgi:16S rRNA processing protein RimM